jgi:predicted transcriptional regulator
MHDESCNTRILNSLPLYLLDRINELKSMHIYEGILYFTKESEDETKKICEHSFSKLYNLDLNKLDINTTLGHYLREIE